MWKTHDYFLSVSCCLFCLLHSSMNVSTWCKLICVCTMQILFNCYEFQDVRCVHFGILILKQVRYFSCRLCCMEFLYRQFLCPQTPIKAELIFFIVVLSKSLVTTTAGKETVSTFLYCWFQWVWWYYCFALILIVQLQILFRIT